MAEKTAWQYFRHFYRDLKEFYGKQYFTRWPTKLELEDIEVNYSELGFQGCARAMDFIHLILKNCPFQDRGPMPNSKNSTRVDPMRGVVRSPLLLPLKCGPSRNEK